MDGFVYILCHKIIRNKNEKGNICCLIVSRKLDISTLNDIDLVSYKVIQVFEFLNMYFESGTQFIEG